MHYQVHSGVHCLVRILLPGKEEGERESGRGEEGTVDSLPASASCYSDGLFRTLNASQTCDPISAVAQQSQPID